MDLKVLYSFLNRIKKIQSPIAFVSITQSITLTFKEKKKYIYIYKVQEKKKWRDKWQKQASESDVAFA